MLNYLAIIPARSGSKGLVDKNIKEICGQSLIEITSRCADKVEKIDKIFFTSDSQEYIDLYKSLNIEKDITGDYIRPSDLASDQATANDYILDCLSYLGKQGIAVKNFIILQVTSPLRQSYNIHDAINLYEEISYTSLVSVYEPFAHPYHCFLIDDKDNNQYEPVKGSSPTHLTERISKEHFTCSSGILPVIESNDKRRQDHKKALAMNGAIYIKDASEYKINPVIKTDKTVLYVMKKILSIDIDDEQDFLIANLLYSSMLEKKWGEINA